MRVVLDFDGGDNEPTKEEIVKTLLEAYRFARKAGTNSPLRGRKRDVTDIGHDPDTRRYVWFGIANTFTRAIADVEKGQYL